MFAIALHASTTTTTTTTSTTLASTSTTTSTPTTTIQLGYPHLYPILSFNHYSLLLVTFIHLYSNLLNSTHPTTSLKQFDLNKEAGDRNIYQRYCIERAVAHVSHVFTTISDILSFEAEHLLAKKTGQFQSGQFVCRRVCVCI